MHLATDILGNVADPDMHARIHRLEHAGAVETITVARADLARRRLKATTDKQRPIAIALPRAKRLEDGAVIVLTDSYAVVVRVEAEAWMRLRPADEAAALRVGYFAGNLHWRVGFDGRDLLVALDRDERLYRERLADLVGEGVVRVIENDVAEVPS